MCLLVCALARVCSVIESMVLVLFISTYGLKNVPLAMPFTTIGPSVREAKTQETYCTPASLVAISVLFAWASFCCPSPRRLEVGTT